ncbi:unnamed protein product [Blepharisma stoltei]|uniref:Arp2/3 complex 41 kDa subunit n=1 Tax=Blepharisma stoltei TaxID=1481888 RepID=A0AAU9IVR2_9CILI|nr:unnamed protein product [Blepharisma stoltei]
MNSPLGITCHAWNNIRTQIVVATNSSVLEIYQVRGEEWDKLYELKEHNQLVSAVDWHPITNRIISCSHDRNVVVWEFAQEWKPNLVNFYQNRAVLDVSWSARGDKFAVGTGSKLVGVGFPSQVLQGWTTKKSRCTTSSVTCIRFDPSGLVVAAGSTDMSIVVMTAYIPEVDSSQTASGRFASINTFGDVIYSLAADAWVNSLCWSPDATWIAIATHKPSMIFTDLQTPQKIDLKGRPFLSTTFIGENKIVAGGFDFLPVSFELAGNSWREGKKYESFEEAKAPAGGVKSSFQIIRDQLDQKKGRAQLSTRHKNFITSIRAINQSGFSTSDILGNIYLWTS